MTFYTSKTWYYKPKQKPAHIKAGDIVTLEFLDTGEIETYTIAMLDMHIAEEISDVQVMSNQFKEYYNIKDIPIQTIMKEKINRQLERIKTE